MGFNPEPLYIRPSKLTHDEWSVFLESQHVQLASNTRYSLDDLYADIFTKHELQLAWYEGEIVRFGRIATVDVFYESDGKRYKLKEQRYKVKPERLAGKDTNDVLREALGEILEGNFDGVMSDTRTTPNSLSERLKPHTEKREEGTQRAVMEKMFDEVLQEVGEDKYPDLKRIIQANLIYGMPSRIIKESDDPTNNYLGIRSVYDRYPASITFMPGMSVPIQVKNGVPQSLHEFEEGQYVNVYTWELIRTFSDPLSFTRRERG